MFTPSLTKNSKVQFYSLIYAQFIKMHLPLSFLEIMFQNWTSINRTFMFDAHTILIFCMCRFVFKARPAFGGTVFSFTSIRLQSIGTEHLLLQCTKKRRRRRRSPREDSVHHFLLCYLHPVGDRNRSS